MEHMHGGVTIKCTCEVFILLFLGKMMKIMQLRVFICSDVPQCSFLWERKRERETHTQTLFAHTSSGREEALIIHTQLCSASNGLNTLNMY